MDQCVVRLYFSGKGEPRTLITMDKIYQISLIIAKKRRGFFI